MNPPRLHNRLLGSLPIGGLLLLLSCGLTYEWWSHQETASVWLPIIAFFIIANVLKARKEVTSYRTWKRSWEAMEGVAPPSPMHGIKALCLFALTVWLGSMTYNLLHRDPPVVDQWGIGFTVLAAAGTLYQLRQWSRHKGPRTQKVRAAKQKEPYVASVCLPIPKEGRLGKIQELPAYCLQLLGYGPAGNRRR